MKISFYIEHFSLRGTEIAIFDYAHYNETILGNKSIIITSIDYKVKRHFLGYIINNEEVEKKYRNRFEVISVTQEKSLNELLIENNCDGIYHLTDGNKYFSLKNICIPIYIHCIFTCNEENKHGDVYAAISEDIIRNIKAPIVPHICEKLPIINKNLRSELGIGDDCLVFGRYGGIETFNIGYVHEVIKDILNNYNNIYFLFLNTSVFYSHPNIKYLDYTTDVVTKAIFVNSCDAMLYARDQGESFGLAIAEFTSLGKPIILQKNPANNYNHITILGNTGIYYDDPISLKNILINFDPKNSKIPINFSDIYSPEKVMKIFNKVFLEHKLRIKISCAYFQSKDIHDEYTKLLGDYPVIFTNFDPDYWIVLDKPSERTDPEKTIVFGMKPDEQWNWCNNKKDYLYFLDHNYMNNIIWKLDINHTELSNNNPTKSKDMIISTIVPQEDDILSLDFLKIAEKHINFDIYGKDNGYFSKNHLLSYKYTFVTENLCRDNYFSDKLVDGILSECLVFYWGCTNIKDYFDSRSYIWLDITNISGSITKIKEMIQNNIWEERIEYIRSSKHRILSYYSLIPRIIGLDKVTKLQKYTINLEKRTDKWYEHCRRCEEIGLRNVSRYNAIDGDKCDLNSEYIKSLFIFTNSLGTCRKLGGVIGCALSHYNLWKLTIENNSPCLIMEDDVEFSVRFVDRLGNLLNDLENKEWDIVFIGHHLNEFVYEIYGLKPTHLQDNFLPWDLVSFKYMQQYSKEEFTGIHGGGSFGYLLSIKGAKKLISNINKTKFDLPIDYKLLLFANFEQIDVKTCAHPLVTTKKNDINSDIEK